MHEWISSCYTKRKLTAEYPKRMWSCGPIQKHILCMETEIYNMTVGKSRLLDRTTNLEFALGQFNKQTKMSSSYHYSDSLLDNTCYCYCDSTSYWDKNVFCQYLQQHEHPKYL